MYVLYIYIYYIDSSLIFYSWRNKLCVSQLSVNYPGISMENRE